MVLDLMGDRGIRSSCRFHKGFGNRAPASREVLGCRSRHPFTEAFGAQFYGEAMAIHFWNAGDQLTYGGDFWSAGCLPSKIVKLALL